MNPSIPPARVPRRFRALAWKQCPCRDKGHKLQGALCRFCSLHWRRWYREGDPAWPGRRTQSP